MPDREIIESALRRVQSGELSPAEATQLLLASESLLALTRRLGTPPMDVVDAWSAQMLSIASLHEHHRGEPLPTVELQDCSLSPQGDLAWKQWTADRVFDRTPSPESFDQVNRFRMHLNPDAEPLPYPDVPSGARVPSMATAEFVASDSENPQPNRVSWLGPRAKQGLSVAAVLVCVAFGGNVIYNATRDMPEVSDDASSKKNSQTFSTNVGELTTPHRNRAIPPSTDPLASHFGASDITAEDLQTFESMSESELAFIESEAEQKDVFSLDDLMPPPAAFVMADTQAPSTIGVPPASDPDDKTKAQAEVNELSETDMLPSDSDESEPPTESLQVTRKSVMAVELRSIDETQEVSSVADYEMQDVSLDFPLDVPLVLGGDTSPWEVRDTRKNTLVGVLQSDSQATHFQWSDSARQSPSVSSLLHGRLKDQSGNVVYLRPTIEADAWPMRADRPDVMPSWNLRHPIPPKVARIRINFELPEEIELAWIEPIEAESVRRGRGVAVLTPKDGETVSLGVRLDVRCSRKLTVRVRYAGRLDSSMPWQVVSESLLEQFANVLTEQAMLVSREKTRLASVYDRAGTSGRRILRVKQRRNDDRADKIRETSTRVAELQSMLAALAVEGFLRANVWVEWPGARQELLVMTKAE